MGCFSSVEAAVLPLVGKLVEEVVFMEGQLDVLKGLPLINVDPANPANQRRTDAGRLYTTLAGAYSGVIEKLVRIQRKGGEPAGEDTPLRAYLKGR